MASLFATLMGLLLLSLLIVGELIFWVLSLLQDVTIRDKININEYFFICLPCIIL